MTLTVYPYKLTQRELEARLEPGLTVLPGQLLKFEGEQPVYGQVWEVRAMPPTSAGMPEGYGVCIRLLYGCPTLEPQQAVLLNATQMAQEVQRLQEPFERPLNLGPAFIGEFSKLGALSLIEGDDFVLKYEALQLFLTALQAHGQLLVIDPLGVFTEEDHRAYYQAGRDVRLSIQSIGSKRFLSAFGELFSPELREEALRAAAEQLPIMNEFVGFSHLHSFENMATTPLKNLMMQNYRAVAQVGIFAEEAEQALNLSQLMTHPVNVMDLSELPAPWKNLFYEQLCQEVLMNREQRLIPVLVYPENYLTNLKQWVQKADEAEISLVMVASPHPAEALLAMANNRVQAEYSGQLALQGDLTLGLPVRLLTQTVEEIPESKPMRESVIAAESTTELEVWAPHPETIVQTEPEAHTDALDLAPPARKPEEQAWWFEVSQPVTEDEEDSDEQPEEVIQSEEQAEAGLSEAAEPVVDLFAPLPEATLSFLTAEQLSELLGSSPEAGTEDEPAAEWEQGAEAIAASVHGEDTEWDLDSKAETKEEEPQATELLPPSTAPVQTESMSSPEETNPPQPDAPEPTIEPEPLAAEASDPEVWESEASKLAVFPEPEEYEKDEFRFELNLDEIAFSEEDEGAGYYSSYLGAGESLPSTVSRSLSQFGETDSSASHPLEEPLFELEPEDSAGPAAVESSNSEPIMQASDRAESSSESSPQPQELERNATDEAMQDALDLIFPQEFSETEPADLTWETEASTELPSLDTTPVDDETMQVHLKQVEPLAGDVQGFQVGERVRHATYGVGVVQRVIPMEASVVLNITFDAVGKRLLDPALCELTREPAG